jgi:hypothetical protein
MDQRQLRTSRRSTIRFVIYAVLVFLVFWSNDTPTLTENIESPPPSKPKDASHQSDQIRDMPAPPVSDSDDTEPEKEYDLPWYPKKDKISTADRIELELKASIAAREMAHEAFRSLEIQGIPYQNCRAGSTGSLASRLLYARILGL